MTKLTEEGSILANKILRLPSKARIIIEDFFPNATSEEFKLFKAVRSYLKRNGLISRTREKYINTPVREHKRKRSPYEKICKKHKFKYNAQNSIKLRKKWVRRCRHEFECAEGIEAKINALKRMAEYGKFKMDAYYHLLRNAYLPKAKGLCNVCGKEQSYCKHHIVPLSRGGTNGDDNLIDICLTCHRAVHPFMKEEQNRWKEDFYRALEKE